MALHVKTGIAAPTTIPTEVGQHFLDTANNIAYISVNTLAVSDWKQTTGGGSGATSLLDLTDTPINYIGAAAKSVVVDDNELGTSFVDPIATMGLSTSYLTGCIPSANANPTLFNMSAGSGIHVDNSIPGKPVFTPIVVPERLGVSVTNIGTQTSTGLSIDISGNIIQQADSLTPTQRRSRFGVGALVHTDLATIVDIAVAFSPGFDTHAQLNDLIDALGFFLTGGNEISGVSGTLSIKKAAGSGFAKGGNADININDPHDVNLVEQDPIIFFTIDQLSVVAGVSTFLDPTSYDNAGTPTTVPANNNATIKYLYLFATGAMSVLQGQEVFSNFAAAVDASGTETIIVPEILSSGILMARIVMQKTATDMDNGTLVRIIPTNAVSSGGGGGVSTTMQQSYDISVAPQITLTPGLGGVEYEDAATPIGASLLKVASSGGSTIHLDVDDTRVTARQLTLTNLPTSDPGGSGLVWNDAGTLKIT